MSTKKRVAIIGGGMAGCSAARELRRAGRETVLFETNSVLGGRARSWHREEMQPDTGINLWFTSFYENLHERIREYGLEDQLVRMRSRILVVARGKWAPLAADSPSTLFRFPFLTMSEKMKVSSQAARRTAQRRNYDLFDPRVLARYDDGSVAEVARRDLSEDLYQYTVRPAIESFWLFGCEEVSSALATTMQAYALFAKFAVLGPGLEAVAEKLVGGTTCRLSSEVTAVTASENGIHLTYKDGDGERSETFDGLVIATPASVAAKLVSSLPNEVATPEQRDFLETQRYVSALSVAYLIDPGILPSENHIVPGGPGVHPIQGIITVPKKIRRGSGWVDKELTFVYPGREVTLELLDKPEDEQYRRTAELARKLWPDFPVDAEPFHVVGWREAMPIPSPGRFRRAATFVTQQKGPVVFAGDYLATPTSEGALQSGIRAAESLLASS